MKPRWFGVCLVALLVGVPGIAEETAGVELSWALAAYRGSDDDGSWIPIEGDTELQAGDRVSIMLELLSPGYVYVLHETSDGLKLLFPRALPHKPAETLPERTHFIPGAGRWIALEDAGGEDAIHVLAAAQPLDDLAAALEGLAATEGDSTVQREAVLDRIATLQAERSDPRQVLRKPAAIGGTLRDPYRAAEVRRFATDISARNVFSESVTLYH